MSVISMKQLLEAGVHFGHQTRRWNPKMAPYIYTERNGIYIIDLQKSVGMVDDAYNAIKDIVADGGTILFVGTKKQAQDAIKAEASKGSKSVDELKKEQDSAAEKRAEKIAEAEAEAKIQKELSEITEKIKAFYIANKGKTAKLKPLVAAAKEMGYDNPMKVTNIDNAKKILELTVA